MATKELVIYQTEQGKEPFSDWLEDLDKTTLVRIRARLDRVEQGHYGDYKSVGAGVFELRFFFGSGYRVYFAEDGNTIVLLLHGGDKSSQGKDIPKAQGYWQDYQATKAKAKEDEKKPKEDR